MTMKKDTSRLFIALVPSPELVRSLEEYRDVQGRSVTSLRWTSPHNLHVTVLYIGQTPQGKIETITGRLAEIAHRTRPFSLRIGSISYAPLGKQTSMVWLNFDHSGAFQTLTDEVVAQLAGAGITLRDSVKPTQKDTNIHCTLARFSTAPQRLEKLGSFSLTGKHLEAHRMTLMESILTPQGPQYREIGSYCFEAS
jgi:2'-5' RNA ligase